MASANPALEDSPGAPAILLPLIAVLACAGVFCVLFLPQDGPFPWWLLVLLALGFVGWGLSRREAACNRTLIPVVAALCTLGILVISRLDTYLGIHQAVSMLVGLLVVCAGQPLWRRYQVLEKVTYPWVAVALLLFVLLRFFGTEVNGARLWFTVGPFTVQPVEAIKLFMVFFMAAYLSNNGPALAAVRTADLGKNLRLVWPLLLVWGVAITSLGLQRDFGMAGLFLGIFLVMLYVAARRWDVILASSLIFIAGAWIVAQHFPYVHARIATWRDPWSDELGRGYQAAQAYFSLSAGGLLGSGYHQGHPGFIPDAATDYAFAAIAEEFGLLGGVAVLALYLALVLTGLKIAFHAADSYTMLLATGFAAILGIQVAVIVGGVIGLFPLTGITLPFVSYGGSSVVANFIMLNFLWLFTCQNRPQTAAARTPTP